MLFGLGRGLSPAGFISDLYIGRGLNTNKQALCLTLNIMTKQVDHTIHKVDNFVQQWSSPIGGFHDQNRTEHNS